MAKYYFHFISNYRGESHYRIYRDGISDNRVTVKTDSRKCVYGDGSSLTSKELEAFNNQMLKDYQEAVAKYGKECVGEYKPFT